jgi:hypothetical protein
MGQIGRGDIGQVIGWVVAPLVANSDAERVVIAIGGRLPNRTVRSPLQGSVIR